MVSAAGAGLQTRIGVGVLILFTAPNLRAVAEDVAAKHGQTVQREEWRLVLPVHLAEIRDAAIHDLRPGVGQFNREYLGETLGRPLEFDGPVVIRLAGRLGCLHIPA